MNNIWTELAKVECGPKMVNQYALYKSIPNKWFDWESNLDKKDIMVIGQDWGPFVALEKHIQDYDPTKEWSEFFSSRTEKFLLRSLSGGFERKYKGKITNQDWERIFFTMAVLFCRSGKHFRGSYNFDEKLGMTLSLPFLKQQIELVMPKVILCLGRLAQRQVEQISGDWRVVKSFNPAAHVDPKVIREQIELVW